MNKELIKTRFSKNLENYEKNAKIQKFMSTKLVDFLRQKKYISILELGCGTGFLTNHINKKIEYDNYKAIDIVGECETYIKQISPKIDFIKADIEDYLKKNEEKFDLIISNASLQWIKDFRGLSELLLKKLKPNGELLFSTFGKENFREIFYISGTGLNYISRREFIEIFRSDNYDITTEEEIHVMKFSSPKDVLKHLSLTGVNAIKNQTWTKSDLVKFENNYMNICSKQPTLTYNPLYIHVSPKLK